MASKFLKKVLSDLLGFCVALFPLRYAKYLLMKTGAVLLASERLPYLVPIMKDRGVPGACIMLQFPEDVAYLELYFRGYVDKGTLDFLQHFLEPEDVVFDVGANLGYYSIFISLVNSRGAVHAFEPVPSTFERLQRNLALNPHIKNIVANQLAVTQTSGKVNVHTFSKLHHGYASISTSGRNDITAYQAVAKSLDDYASEKGVRQLEFIKVDVEGAEQQVVLGASNIIRKWAPSIMLEINFESAHSNSFEPTDLLRYLGGLNDYTLFRFPNAWGHLTPMSGPMDVENGDNVIAISPRHLRRLHS